MELDAKSRPRRSESASAEVRVKLGEIYPLLIDALKQDRAWLEDFSDEPISISTDLHDVIQAYRSFSRDAA